MSGILVDAVAMITISAGTGLGANTAAHEPVVVPDHSRPLFKPMLESFVIAAGTESSESQVGRSSGTITLTYDRSSAKTRKVCQLTGDTDWLTGKPTQSQSWTQAGVPGADLGVTSYHNGRPWILFGDVNYPRNPGKVGYSDPYGYINSKDGDSCLSIAWEQEVPGTPGDYHPVQVRPEYPAGMPGSDVPLAVFDDSGQFYSLTTANNDMSRSNLNVSTDNGRMWRTLYWFSTRHFINVSVEIPGDGWIYFFGTGNGPGSYRNFGQIYLARVPAGQNAIGTGTRPETFRFFTGLDNRGNPTWSGDENAATPVIDERSVHGGEGGLGELSVHRIPVGGRQVWMALYNCGVCTTQNGAAIIMKTAATPWGPWSPSQNILDPVLDGAFCSIIYAPACPNSKSALRDTQSPGWHDGTAAGGLYAPYLIPHLTKQIDAHTVRIFFTVSTWVPYNSVEMATDLHY